MGKTILYPKRIPIVFLMILGVFYVFPNALFANSNSGQQWINDVVAILQDPYTYSTENLQKGDRRNGVDYYGDGDPDVTGVLLGFKNQTICCGHIGFQNQALTKPLYKAICKVLGKPNYVDSSSQKTRAEWNYNNLKVTLDGIGSGWWTMTHVYIE